MKPELSRRSLLASAAGIPLTAAAQSRRIPVGLELYSVRDELAKDVKGTVTAVAKMGYQMVEFYSPYYQWTPAYAREIRKLMDDLGIRCGSTHNEARALAPEGLGKAIELNGILGAKYVVMAMAEANSADGWKSVAGVLAAASEKLQPAGLRAGYHNHQSEFRPLADGKMPIEIIAANTPKNVLLQLDVGTCVEMKYDPARWIQANPGRIQCLHLKEWGAAHGYESLFGEGDVKWAQVFAAAEKAGGVEFYLIEQEASRLPQLEAARRCLANYRKGQA
jgi:sugar phosphate isomerase/epimerase